MSRPLTESMADVLANGFVQDWEERVRNSRSSPLSGLEVNTVRLFAQWLLQRYRVTPKPEQPKPRRTP